MNSFFDEYNRIKGKIEERLKEFKRIWERKNCEEIFKEFIFCLLTPQSKAKVCFEAVLNLEKKGILYKESDYLSISKELKGVRFKNIKAKYIIENREKFLEGENFLIIDKLLEFDSPFTARDYLVKNVKGYGLKESSHFLRNIGYSFELSILDRHILKNLFKEGIIEEIPKSLNRTKYLEIEKKFRDFSKKVNIPMQNLDLFFWFRETGEVFK